MSQLDTSRQSNARFDATIVIVTKDRKEELRKAVLSALEQEGRLEVLVIDDGSTDGTADMVRAEFPNVRLDRTEQSQGLIAQRSRAAQLVSSPIIVSIDDDAVFSTPHTIQETLHGFNHPRVGAVSIPSIDVNQPDQPCFHQRPPDDAVWAVETYRGTAHAIRRDLFSKLGGYKDLFFRQGEEGEYCIRLLNAGYITRLGSASPIHHFESPKRDRSQMFAYDARNRVLSAWYGVPLPQLLVHLPATMLQAIRHGLRHRYGWASCRGVLMGIGMTFKQLGQRKPVSRQVYRLSRQLRKRGPAKLEAIESSLPELSPCRP
jgi:GT2 family glycosyltransferase